MLSHKVFGSGIPGLSVQALCQDVATGITAAGTVQGDATALTSHVNVVSTVAANTGVILYSTAVPVDSQVIFNGGANPLNVYPPSGSKINNLPANGAVILPTNTVMECICVSSTQFIAILSA